MPSTALQIANVVTWTHWKYIDGHNSSGFSADPVYTGYVHRQVYKVSRVSTATLYIVVDNFLDALYFNNQNIGGPVISPTKKAFQLNVVSGTNLILFIARSVDYISGCVLSLLRDSDKAILVHSDSTWNRVWGKTKRWKPVQIRRLVRPGWIGQAW